ncbi:MAG: hypothetical protein IT286_02640 [Proteobacteria bacterium]|jgi:hypothetical protein|nr:hypothetical protein [Pseudomonadota bacterium]
MGRILKFLVTVVGLPLLAHQLQTQSQPDKLALITFLSERKKDILKIYLIGLTGGIFAITGLVLSVFSFVQVYDLNLNTFMTGTMITSLSTLGLGLILGLVAWSKTSSMVEDYEAEEQHQDNSVSLPRMIINSIINSFTQPSNSRNYFETSDHDRSRNMLN